MEIKRLVLFIKKKEKNGILNFAFRFRNTCGVAFQPAHTTEVFSAVRLMFMMDTLTTRLLFKSSKSRFFAGVNSNFEMGLYWPLTQANCEV